MDLTAETFALLPESEKYLQYAMLAQIHKVDELHEESRFSSTTLIMRTTGRTIATSGLSNQPSGLLPSDTVYSLAVTSADAASAGIRSTWLRTGSGTTHVLNAPLHEHILRWLSSGTSYMVQPVAGTLSGKQLHAEQILAALIFEGLAASITSLIPIDVLRNGKP
ncbi:hypothetical protein TeGR_g6430, partial [Tetraparma gracilis]